MWGKSLSCIFNTSVITKNKNNQTNKKTQSHFSLTDTQMFIQKSLTLVTKLKTFMLHPMSTVKLLRTLRMFSILTWSIVWVTHPQGIKSHWLPQCHLRSRVKFLIAFLLLMSKFLYWPRKQSHWWPLVLGGSVQFDRLGQKPQKTSSFSTSALFYHSC